jgi:transposase
MRFVFRADTPGEAKSILGGWLAWASRSRLPEFTRVAQTVRRKQELIWNTLDAGLSNVWPSHCTSCL